MTNTWNGVLLLEAHSHVGPLAHIQNLQPGKSKRHNPRIHCVEIYSPTKEYFRIRTPRLKVSSQTRDSPVGTRYYPFHARIPKWDTWHTFSQELYYSGYLNLLKT
jgi:hypothetical protein